MQSSISDIFVKAEIGRCVEIRLNLTLKLFALTIFNKMLYTEIMQFPTLECPKHKMLEAKINRSTT